MQIEAIVDCMAVADYINYESHWKPKDNGERFYFNIPSNDSVVTVVGNNYNSGAVLFKTRRGAEEALLILGTETIKTALGL